MFYFGVLEVLRRVIWNCFRLENEQLHNADGFRAVKQVLHVVAHVSVPVQNVLNRC
jgi:hypothetical protein